eukprot:scaffold35380_cov69-Phaeocystis_antarctica.AAC.2
MKPPSLTSFKSSGQVWQTTVSLSRKRAWSKGAASSAVILIMREIILGLALAAVPLPPCSRSCQNRSSRRAAPAIEAETEREFRLGPSPSSVTARAAVALASLSAFSSTTPAATLATLQLQLASFSASEARPQAPSSSIVVNTVAFCLWIFSDRALRATSFQKLESPVTAHTTPKLPSSLRLDPVPGVEPALPSPLFSYFSNSLASRSPTPWSPLPNTLRSDSGALAPTGTARSSASAAILWRLALLGREACRWWPLTP